MSAEVKLTPSVQLPSVGRAVHYIAYGTPNGEFPSGVRRAATITEVDEPGNPESKVGLCVMNPTGLFFNQHLPFDADGSKVGSWTWPVFVPPVAKA